MTFVAGAKLRARKNAPAKSGRSSLATNRRINVRVDAALLDATMLRVQADAAAGRSGVRGRWNLTALIHKALTDYTAARDDHAEY